MSCISLTACQRPSEELWSQQKSASKKTCIKLYKVITHFLRAWDLDSEKWPSQLHSGMWNEIYQTDDRMHFSESQKKYWYIIWTTCFGYIKQDNSILAILVGNSGEFQQATVSHKPKGCISQKMLKQNTKAISSNLGVLEQTNFGLISGAVNDGFLDKIVWCCYNIFVSWLVTSSQCQNV